MGFTWHHGLRIVLFLALIFWIIFDWIFDDDMLLASANFSYDVQQWGGKPLKYIGLVFTDGFAYIVFPLMYLVFVLVQTQLYALYYFFIFAVPNILSLWLKLTFYKGRPYVVNKGLGGSTCDPGMPSGHSILAVSGYYTIFLIITNELYPKNKPVKYVTGILCTLIAICIMLSRITLGDHGYNQVIMGFLLSANIVLNIDLEIFTKLMTWLWPKVYFVLIPLEIFSITFLLVMNYINHTYRENPTFWKYMDKNPLCENTFILGSAFTVPLVSWLIGSFFWYPFNRIFYQPQNDVPLTCADSTKRILIHFAVALPGLIMGVPLYVVYKSTSMDLYTRSAILSILMIILLNYLAFATVNLSKRVLECFDLARPSDYLLQSPFPDPDEIPPGYDLHPEYYGHMDPNRGFKPFETDPKPPEFHYGGFSTLPEENQYHFHAISGTYSDPKTLLMNRNQRNSTGGVNNPMNFTFPGSPTPGYSTQMAQLSTQGPQQTPQQAQRQPVQAYQQLPQQQQPANQQQQNQIYRYQ